MVRASKTRPSRGANPYIRATCYKRPKPHMVLKDGGFEGRRFMETVEQYAANEVWNFISPPAPPDTDGL